MTDPARLSATFLDAFNRRDLDLLERMTADPTDYKRAGVEAPTLRSPAEVRARYAADFEATPDIRAEVTEVIAQTDADVAFEIRLTTSGLVLAGAAHHRWVDGRLTRYRAWVDPLRG